MKGHCPPFVGGQTILSSVHDAAEIAFIPIMVGLALLALPTTRGPPV
jgi:hypothetical protein